MIIRSKRTASAPYKGLDTAYPGRMFQEVRLFGKSVRNTIKKRAFVFVIFFAACILFSFRMPLSAQSKVFHTYYNFLYGAKSLAMGNAFTGAADDLTAVFRNPAGLANFAYPSFHMNYRSDKMGYDFETQEHDFGTEVHRFDYSFVSKSKNIGFLSISAPVKFWDVKWNFALSYYRFVPYGLKGNYHGEFLRGSDRSETYLNFFGSGGIDVLAFTTAIHLLKGAAFGVTFQRFLNTGSQVYDPDWGVPGREISEKIDGGNVILGLLVEVYKDVNIGFAYHTPLKGTFHTQRSSIEDGVATDEVDEEDELYMPAKFSLGTHIRLVKFLNLSYEFSRIYWTKGKVGDYAFPGGVYLGGARADIMNHRFGIESPLALKETLVVYLRTGFSWDKQLFRSGDGAGIWLKGYAFGCGVHVLPRVKLELAFMHQWGKWLEPGYYDHESFIDVKYRNNILSMGLTYYFAPPVAPERLGRMDRY